MKKIFSLILLGGLLVGCSIQSQEMPKEVATNLADEAKSDVWLGSLITKTPQEGRELAMMMARKTIGAIQSDPNVKKKIRGEYAEDGELLILSAQVVAIEFQTVAAANNYWR